MPTENKITKQTNNINKEVITEVVNTKQHNQFSIFQILIFCFLFVIMIWIIGFLTIELKNQKQTITAVNEKLKNLENINTELVNNYVNKIRDLQKLDIKTEIDKLKFDKNYLNLVEAKVNKIEEYNNKYRGVNILKFISLLSLKNSFDNGNVFEPETIRTIFKDNKDVKELLELLENYKKRKIPSDEELKTEFYSMANSIVFDIKTAGFSPRQKLLKRILGLVKIRKIDFKDKTETNNPEIIITEIEKNLHLNNFEVAIKLFEMLPLTHKNYEWYNKAKEKNAVSQKIKLLLNTELQNINSLLNEQQV